MKDNVKLLTDYCDKNNISYSVDTNPSEERIKKFKAMSVIKMIVSDGKMAKFQKAIAGVLYYQVHVAVDCCYEFPVDMNDREDVGTATFDASIKAITLMRYIRKAEANGTLINIGFLPSEPGAMGVAGSNESASIH